MRMSSKLVGRVVISTRGMWQELGMGTRRDGVEQCAECERDGRVVDKVRFLVGLVARFSG